MYVYCMDLRKKNQQHLPYISLISLTDRFCLTEMRRAYCAIRTVSSIKLNLLTPDGTHTTVTVVKSLDPNRLLVNLL
jgi:hypothetical protein